MLSWVQLSVLKNTCIKLFLTKPYDETIFVNGLCGFLMNWYHLEMTKLLAKYLNILISLLTLERKTGNCE